MCCKIYNMPMPRRQHRKKLIHPAVKGLSARALEYLHTTPSQKCSVRGLARALGIDPGNLSRTLVELEDDGLVVSSVQGLEKQYALDVSHPLYHVSKPLYWKHSDLATGLIIRDLALGDAISGDHIQSQTSRWSARHFARLCNSLAWASARSQANFPPDFTENVNASDDGIDASWERNIEHGAVPSTLLLTEGLNVFQYKVRNCSSRKPSDVINDVRSKVRKALVQIQQRTGVQPQNYVLFVNFNVDSKNKKRLEEAVREGYGEPESVKVKVAVIGSAELAPMLNSIPYLRSSFFSLSKCLSWHRFAEKHERAKPWQTIPLIGREGDLAKLKGAIENSSVKAIVLAGSPGIGKSRIVLEATRSQLLRTIVVDDPQSVRPGNLEKFEGDGPYVIVVVEDSAEEDVRPFIDEALSRSHVKVIITLPTASDALLPAFGTDQRIFVHKLEPLSLQQSEEFLKAAGKRFDYGLMTWIVEQAGGNPSVLLAAAETDITTREVGGLVEKVGVRFEGQVRKQLGEQRLRVLQLFSALSQVGVAGSFVAETKIIREFFAPDLDVGQVLDSVGKLQQAGFLKVNGVFVEVSLPILASRLCTRLFCQKPEALLALFVRLQSPAQTRLLRRLNTLKSEEIGPFWDELFGSRGLFSSLPALLRSVRVLRLIAGAVPERVLAVLKQHVEPLSTDQVEKIEDGPRQEFVSIINQLLLRRRTSAEALRLSCIFAQPDENTRLSSTNSLFCPAFHPLHPQVPLLLDDRLAILQELCKPSYPLMQRFLVVKAASGAFDRMGSYFLRRSESYEPLDTCPSMTWGDMWRYLDGVVRLMLNLSNDEDVQVSKKARHELPMVLAEYTIQARPDEGIELLRALVREVTECPGRFEVAEVTRAIRLARDVFRDRLFKEGVRESEPSKT